MKNTKIEWCDSTWNPVTGCEHGCEYCYARQMANRFKGYDKITLPDISISKRLNVLEAPAEKNGKVAPYPFDFKPTFHKYLLSKPQRWKKPRTIFVCSMADLFGEWVPDEWIEEVFAACEKAPQHTFLFLTKNSKRYAALHYADKLPAKKDMRNIWLGATATDCEQIRALDLDRLPRYANTFLSIEPLTEDVASELYTELGSVMWLIIGAETGNRKNKIVPQKEWVENICRAADEVGLPVFMKDSLSWVAKLIEWWIDPETGYPIKERSGKIRYMARQNEAIIWGDTREELIKQGIKPSSIKSFTFIASTLQDNQVLMQLDPSYLANLEALPLVERERLLYGNWKIKSAAGLFFNRNQVGNMLPVVPRDVTTFVRAWDLAATSETEGGEPAYTAGVLMGRRADGRFIVIDVINVRQSAGEVRATIKRTAMMDNAIYGNVKVRLPQDPGQAGKDQAQSFALLLAGLNFRILPVSGSKETRAEPVAAQWQAGNFDIIVAGWNEEYFAQLESFPSSKFKDMVDATSDAFSELVQITERDKLHYPA